MTDPTEKPPSRSDTKTFKMLIDRKERMWSQIQRCYGLIENLPDKKNVFQTRAKTLEVGRADFQNVLDQLATMSCDHRDFTVDTLQITNAYDDLFFEIMSVYESISEKETELTKPSIGPVERDRVRRPEIQITKFDGSPDKFPAFIGLYNSLIHNSTLSDIEKFSYLRGYLEGNALRLVQKVSFVPENYIQAYDLLIKRYTNKRLIANHYISAILSLPQLKSDAPQQLQVFLDTLMANVIALKALAIPKLEEYILLEIVLRLLDPNSRRQFETKFIDEEYPTLDCVIDFLQCKCDVTEIIGSSSISSNKSGLSADSKTFERKRVHMLQSVESSSPQNNTASSCPLCKGNHGLIKCPEFIEASPRDRHQLVKQFQRCFACIGNHRLSDCASKNACRICKSKRHNTLLHFECTLSRGATPSYTNTSIETDVSASENKFENKNSPTLSIANSCSLTSDSLTLLGTAEAKILDSTGQWYYCRIVLDYGSHVNLITSNLANRLALTHKKCPYSLYAVGQTNLGHVQGLVHCKIASLHSKESIINFDAVVLPRITTDLPPVPLSSEIRKRFSHLQLADPRFDTPSTIDILLGVGTYDDLAPIVPEHIKGNPNAILTTLGWVIMGSVLEKDQQSLLLKNIMSLQIDHHSSLDAILRSFWENEEIPQIPALSPEDVYCEEHFQTTTSRDVDGRLIVRLPFKNGIRPSFSSNREHAIKRFAKLELQFKRDPFYCEQYAKNIQDYISQGHLVPASKSVPYILTHHGVRKEGPSGLSVRVVFNPAEKDNEGVSLNDTLLSGPKLQAEIGQIITRFRLHRIALTCDIRQMFREVKLHPDDCCYQHIFWRFSPDESLSEWEHTRVIFGASSSPFLAQRSLKRLVEEEGENYALAKSALEDGIYVDDILWGADDEFSAILLRDQLIDLLNKGGFQLGKWASSDRAVVDSEYPSKYNLLNGLPTIKILGLHWNPDSDSFCYVVHPSEDVPTKRGLLSRVARTYDLNGYLAPFVFCLKSLIQQLWLHKIDWDEKLPPQIFSIWARVLEELPDLESISIPRYVLSQTMRSARLVGFSDASSLGMAAVVYLRVELDNSIQVSIVAAKTRVAPLKTWTIPRLELGASCLLSKLLATIVPAFSSIVLETPICLTDSTTVLQWLSTPPHLLKTFVSNRVVQIHEYVPDARWNYVPGPDNPADPASRGLLPVELSKCDLWWNGPSFLYKPLDVWPRFIVDSQSQVPECKKIPTNSLLLMLDPSPFDELFSRISHLGRLQRIIAYVRRYVHNLRAKATRQNTNCRVGNLSACEYREALELAARISQAQYLNNEIKLTSRGKLCSKRYRALSPFLDSRGLLMVGGRLKFSSLSESQRHPILVPRESQLAVLLVDHYHFFSGHGGPKLVQSFIQRKFWIPSVRSLIRHRIFRCLVCYRFKAEPIQPSMADLPDYRVQPSRTFSHTGLDFAGPFQVKASLLRSKQTVKCYVALFVCMVTKAIHLESVTTLSTDSCIASLDRFIARRGLPNKIYSDQGRNFRGAAREMNEIAAFLQSTNSDLTHYLASREVEWCFNPPYAPNFGGLWEAGVKSFKHHFKRCVGLQILSLEEFNTVLTRIEGILNSRPLCALSNSPEDGFDCLTPGHFLIGGPILSRPEEDVLDIPQNRLGRWQLTRQLVQSFWKRWSKEYLHTQMLRPKWFATKRTVSVGDIVFFFSPGVPPTQWPRGRVTELIPGADGVVRVVRIRTATGEVIRPLNKVVPLPCD